VPSLARTVLGVALLTALAAGAGGWIGIQYGLRASRAPAGLDEVLHRELNLTPEQDQRIHALEAEFAVRRMALEEEMRAANGDLAAAIAAEPTYGTRARTAIERFHAAESQLQELTVQHVLAMRTVLTPEQMTRFDEEVAKALTAN
jgi:Spy/CpxP family protein refolding chaperone